MSPKPWTEQELASLAELGPSDWRGFHERHPDRSYDSWEVKRRRVAGSAGMGRRSVASIRRDFSAVQALRTLAEYVEAHVGA